MSIKQNIVEMLQYVWKIIVTQVKDFGGDVFCTLCSHVNLALIKYLCFLVELLTLLPPLVSCLSVSDDICAAVYQHPCPFPCLFVSLCSISAT